MLEGLDSPGCSQSGHSRKAWGCRAGWSGSLHSKAVRWCVGENMLNGGLCAQRRVGWARASKEGGQGLKAVKPWELAL